MADLAFTVKELQQELEALREENAKLREYCEKQKESHRQKEESLKSSEKNYHKLYSLIRLMSDTMPDMLWAKDLNKQFLFVNESMCKNLLNASDTFEPIGKTDLYFAERERQSHPEDPNWHTFGELCMDSDAVTLKEMRPMQFDEFGNVKGEFLFLDVHKAPLINNKGKLIGIVGSARDITKSKNIEAALKDSENEYRSLVENMHEGLIVVDTNYIIRFVNQAICDILGYSREELIGKIGYQLLLSEKDQKYIYEKYKDIKAVTFGREEVDLIKKNGGVVHFLMSTSPLKNNDGNVIASFATFLDITQQKEAADLAERIKRNYEYFFNSIGDFLFVLDTKGNIIHVNNTVKNRLGYSDEELLGNSVLMVHPEERREEAGKIVAEMLVGKAEFCPVPLKSKSGDYIPVETRVTFGMWDDKPAIFGVTKDISAISLSEEKFSKAFHLNPSACGFSDIETGVYIEVNEAFTSLLGYTQEEAIGKSPYELGILTEESKNNILLKAKDDGVISNIEATLKAKNGETKHVLLSAENMFIQDRHVRYTVVHDITQRKKYEKALFESNLLFENVIKGTRVGTWKWNIQTGETEFNERWAEILGYKLEELMPVSINTWIKLAHPDDLITSNSLLEKVFNKSLDYYDHDCRMKHKDCSWVWIQDRGKVVEWTEDEKPLIMAGTHVDITDRKLAEEALRESEDRYRAVSQYSNNAICIVNEFAKVEWVNHQMLTISGYTEEQILNASSFASFIAPESQEFIFSNFKKVLLGEDYIHHYEFNLIHADGSRRLYEKYMMHFTDKYGKLKLLIDMTDITERKRAKKELEKHRKHLEDIVKERTAELDKANLSLRREIEKQKEYEMLLKNSLAKEKELSMMKSSFISTASHEFRTPLTSILSSSEMLQRYKKRWDEAKKDEHFDRIKRQVGYLTKLLDDVLLISKTESGKIEYKPSEVNIRQLIEDCLKESKSQMQESHKVVKKFSCKKNTFHVDSKLMRFIISNLLSNAIKFSPNGGKIEIKTDCNAKDLKLAICDQGIGLAPVEVNKIFQSFYRAANVGAISGTGLGLSIVNHAVELHGGKIMVKSELGKGTTFEVSIPLSKIKAVKSN